jgi:PAS domain S-box-containing protein
MPHTHAQVKVLIVDDLADKLLVYRSILEESGLLLTCVQSGPDALKEVLQDEFAVILLDVNMPVMDGFETAKLIRSRKRSSHTPIIFLTSHADELHALRGYASGAVDYILTPVVPEILRTKVRVFAELFRLNMQVRDQAAKQIASAEREQAHLTDLLERATDCFLRVDPSGAVIHMNRGGRIMLGFGEVEELPRALGGYQPHWAAEVLRTEALPTAKREGVWFGESALRARNGGEIPVSHVVLAHYSPDGVLEHYSVLARDISERRNAEAELARHRAHLEELVRERTAELEASHERLRLTDRLASIGTLAAGLGHDMGNLLLPVRIRIEALQQMQLPAAAERDVQAIAEACEYLRRLSNGLRLFALSPTDPLASGASTQLEQWWEEVAPFLRNALPRGVELVHAVPAGLARLAIPPHMLTQAVYNLVQNAGEALRSRGSGRVTISATGQEDRVVLSVADDGPGMTEDVRRRCIEPFFTTKVRGISTGLGLALVSGALAQARGSLDVESAPGAGATFRMSIPVFSGTSRADAPASATAFSGAYVSLKSPQLSAYVVSELRTLGVEVVQGPWTMDLHAAVVVLDGAAERAEELISFVRMASGRRAIVVGPAMQVEYSERITFVGERPAPAALRAAIIAAVAGNTVEQVECAS